jgi:HK97 family phage major capsid protein
MPKTLEKQSIQQKCDRLAELKGQMEEILYADGAPREYTAEEGKQFDTLAAEAKTLAAEIKAHKEDPATHRLETMEDLQKLMDEPRPLGHRRDNPEDELRAARLAFKRGRYGLRFFSNEDRLGHDRAYTAGLLMLATCGTGALQQWAAEKCRDKGVDVRRLSPFQAEDGNSQGGYLVFPEFEATLINLKEKYGILQQEAFKLPMTSDTLIIPRRAGGTTVYYPGENSQLTESAMKFDQVQLVAKKYAQMTRWSTELNEDSVIAMADLLAGEFAYQFAKAEDFNGAIGDGTSTYAGVLGFLFVLINGKNGITPSASLAKAASTHTTVATTTLADWEAVVGALPLYAEGRAKWYMHKTTFWAGPARLMDAAGGNIAMFLSSGAPLRFLGYDVVPMQAMPTAALSVANTATGVPAVLGDMSMTSYMGVRRGVTVRTSDQRYIEFDQIAIQATQRVAINNVVGDAVAPTTVAGPMVGLQLYF